MTQANNRQGQGGGEVVPFIEGGAAPRLDRVARWGGTESNRARAARNGFAFTAPSEPGTVIARLDTTGPEPVGSVSRDGGQTWEDAPRWPAPLDVLPGVIVMSAWRRPDGALVAEGSDGVDRVTKPGEIRTPEDADRLFGEGFGLGRWMRENAGAAAIDVLPAPTAPALPAPAPGQVWVPPAGEWADRFVDADGTVTVATADGTAVRFVGGGGCADVDMDGPANGWRCVGVATEHGRVMVGDAFCPAMRSPEWTITGIAAAPGSVTLRSVDGRECSNDAEQIAATWDRARYASARTGERYRSREPGGAVITIEVRETIGDVYAHAGGRAHPLDVLTGVSKDGTALDPAQWERLDPATPGPRVYAALKVSVNGRELRDVTDDLRLDKAEGADLDALASIFGVKRRKAAQPSDAQPPLTLQAPARDLRALADAIGRALELPATRHACPFGAGLTVTVLRDEMLFTPTATTGIGTADLCADARALCALRSAVGEAMATGRATLAQWGAKGPRVEVVREGPAMGATTASEPAEPVRYTPSEGGADAWRWETGK